MARFLIVALVAATVGCFSCAPKPAENETPSTMPKTEAVPLPRGRAAAAPKLVVLIIVDQLGSWVLDSYLPLLPKSSLLRRVSEQGVYLQAAFPFASTQTAPGHTSLATGVPPSMHGVVANAVFDPERGPVKIVDDHQHTVIGNPERFVSPLAVAVPAVADALRQKTNGEAKIVGISMKARAAALSVGKGPTAAVFFDAKAQSLTTSTYYAPNGRLPEWLSDFIRANPVERLLEVWEPEQPRWLEARLGPYARDAQDDQEGQAALSFAHDPKQAPDPYAAFSAVPESTDYLIAGAFAAVKAEGMGLDESPDLLVLGVSGTDIVGHMWGARSWEYADNLLRTDRALGRFASILQSRGPVAFVLTADHGVAAMPERVRREGGIAGRIAHDAVMTHAERAADASLGAGDWIAAYVPPLITYTKAGRERHRELTRVLGKAMPRLQGVRAVYDAPRGADLRASNQLIERLVGASLPADPPGDLYLVTDEGWFDALADRGGTNHGTPWPYDRQVPILMWGTAIEPRVSNRVHSALSVATTVAALLDVPAPALAPQEPLPGVMRLHD
ncbi:MAG: alkaline phosphatase family protein [Myxococcota bacterium]